MSVFEENYQKMKERLTAIEASVGLSSLKEELVRLQGLMQAGDFWADQEKARRISKEAADMEKEITTLEGFRKELEDAKGFADMAESEGDEKEGEKLFASLEGRLAELELKRYLSGEHDKSNAILSIHAGAGGVDAMDWAEMLSRMYARYAEAKGFTISILEQSLGEEAGIKRIMFLVEGLYAYGYLKEEAGVHRLVRQSPFNADGLRQTSFALVEVVPVLNEIEEKNLVIPDGDLRIDTYASSGAGGQSVNTTNSAVRITHIPTNIVVAVQNERSQTQNRETAMKILKARIHQKMIEEQKKELSELKGGHIKPEWGSQIRSYVVHPYKMVKDHRTEVETTDTEAVLNGDLDQFIEASLRAK